MLGLLLVLLLIVAIASMPVWPYNRGWQYGYTPSGGLGILILIIAGILLIERFRM